MSFICTDDLLALIVHAVDIVLVSIVQLIHLADEVVSLISQSSKIVLQPSLLRLGIHCSLSESLKLVIQVSKSVTVTIMFCFKFSQLIILPQKVGIQLVGFSGNVFSCCLLVT